MTNQSGFSSPPYNSPKDFPLQFQKSHLLATIIKENVEKFFIITPFLCSEGFPSEERLSSTVSIIPIGKTLPLLKSYLQHHVTFLLRMINVIPQNPFILYIASHGRALPSAGCGLENQYHTLELWLEFPEFRLVYKVKC